MGESVIDVKDLVKKFNGRSAVLDGVSFSVAEGEFVMVFGKSGCGKTTLLNILGGLDRPTSGNVIIDGQDIVDLSEDDLAKLRLAKIGFVFQDYNLLMDLTVRENVALPLRFSRKKDGGRVDSLLDKFDITHIANETANKISGGEAQRAAIARAKAPVRALPKARTRAKRDGRDFMATRLRGQKPAWLAPASARRPASGGQRGIGRRQRTSRALRAR